jgi:hypothetical protein
MAAALAMVAGCGCGSMMLAVRQHGSAISDFGCSSYAAAGGLAVLRIACSVLWWCGVMIVVVDQA